MGRGAARCYVWCVVFAARPIPSEGGSTWNLGKPRLWLETLAWLSGSFVRRTTRASRHESQALCEASGACTARVN